MAQEKTTGTVTVDGVEAPYDTRTLEDVRVMLAIGDLQSDEVDDAEKTVVMADFTRLMFGPGRRQVMAALAEKEGGHLPVDAFVRWLGAYLEAVGAKN